MLPSTLLGALALAITPIAADGAAIVESLGTLSASSSDLNNTVAEWSGKLLHSFPIVTKSLGLLKDTKDATEVAEDSEVLTVSETAELAGAMQGLIKDIDDTLTTLGEAKPKFDKLLMGPVILIDLKLQKKETDKLSAAVIEKVPEALQDVAKGMVEEVSGLFDKAIEEFAIKLPF